MHSYCKPHTHDLFTYFTYSFIQRTYAVIYLTHLLYLSTTTPHPYLYFYLAIDTNQSSYLSRWNMQQSFFISLRWQSLSIALWLILSCSSTTTHTHIKLLALPPIIRWKKWILTNKPRKSLKQEMTRDIKSESMGRIVSYQYTIAYFQNQSISAISYILRWWCNQDIQSSMH